MTKTFSLSQQHYLFSVQAFAQTVLTEGGQTFEYALRDRTTKGVIADVADGTSDLGVMFQTSASAPELDAAFDEAGVEFVHVASSAPRVALPASHPLVNAKSLTLDELADYPYVYFEQEEGVSKAFYEEALSEIEHAKSIATTDRATLSELIAAVNGFTVTSGILVGVTDGDILRTVPLDHSITLELGYLKRKGAEVTGVAKEFVDSLTRHLDRYAAK